MWFLITFGTEINNLKKQKPGIALPSQVFKV